MVTLYAGVTLKTGFWPGTRTMKVRVYFNLHKRTFSIQDYKSRIVLAHRDFIYLTDVEFKVYESGRQRVLRENKKNVHAFVIGELSPWDGLKTTLPEYSRMTRIWYNPYKHEQFVDVASKPVHKAKAAILTIQHDARSACVTAVI